MSYFVVGTDTDVGKTLLSCALLEGFAAQGLSVVGMKPVSAGVNEHGVNEDVRLLRAAGNVEAAAGQINPYRFEQAVAPHLAARFAGVNIDLSRIVESYRELATQADVVIVEGAGGFRVPLNRCEDGADLAKQLNLPLILVVGMRLGCLNHALLTVEAILSRGLRLAGWVANCVDKDMSMLAENIAALQTRINAPLLGVVPHCQNLPNLHGKCVTHDNETLHARFPHPNPLPSAGEGADEALSDFLVTAREMAKYLDLVLLSR